MPKSAVLLLQMGGPDNLDGIEPFLYNLFCDRDIIRIGPAFLQPLLARMITRRRTGKVAPHYEMIGGRSPLRELTDCQAAALEQSLGPDYRCFVAMRYSSPDTREALAAIQRAGISHIIALPLYPHFSKATTGSSLNELRRVTAQSSVRFELQLIEDYHDHPQYIRALAEKIEKGLQTFGDRNQVQLLFTAHGLPRSFVEAGDPYLEQIEATARLVMSHFEGTCHHLAFQSRAGPVKWLEPSTGDKIRELGASGVKQLLLVPVSFVSDHIETLYEIDIELRQLALDSGITHVERTEALNDAPAFIACLKELVLQADTGRTA